MSTQDPASDDIIPSALPQYGYTMHLVFFIVNTLSLIGQIFTIVTYRNIRTKKNKFYGYIAWHSVIGIPWVVTNYFTIALATDRQSESCRYAAIAHSTAYLAYMLWSSVIAFVILASLRKQQPIPDLKTWYVGLTYVISIALMIYPMMEGDFRSVAGRGMRTCYWGNISALPFYIGYYIPLGITTMLNLICYGWSLLLVRENASPEDKKAFKSFLFFPLLSLICNSQLLLKRFELYLLAGRRSYYIYFEVFHIIMGRGQGLFEALVYWFKVRIEIKKSWNRAKRRNQKKIDVPLVFDESSIENEIKERYQKQIQYRL